MRYPKLLGKFPLGFAPVKVFVTDSSGGEGFVRTNGKTPQIVVGLDEEAWSDVLAVALHEAFEVTAMQMGTHFEPTLDTCGDSGRYVFVMNHKQFSEACGRVGLLMASMTPALAKAYKKFKA